jgi:hypothetical protein
LFQAIVLNDTPVYFALDEDANKKVSQIIKNLLKYDIEVFKIETSDIEDVGSITKGEFISRMSNAQPVVFDDYFLMDELRRVI